MSENNVAMVITVGFFVWMVAWALLVERWGRKLLEHPERVERTEKRVEQKRETQGRKGRGYEAAVLIVMVTAIGSLGLLLN